VLAACGGDDDSATDAPAGSDAPAPTDAPDAPAPTDAPDAPAGTDAPAPSDTPADDPLAALAADCTAEGKVNLIALPDEWANYKGILASFGEKYPGVEYPVQNPNASSQEELDAINNLAGQADMPDAIDVSPAKAQIAKDEGLWEPYTPTSIGEVPANLQDPDGNWIAAYYGVISIFTNTTIITDGAPTTFADLKDPKYKGKVGLNGDPRESGSGFAAVMAAAIANGGGPDDIMPGIQYFADLKASGNLIPIDVTQATVISGETPIAIDWSYNLPGLAAQIEEAGYTYELNFPSDGVYGGYYSQGVVKNSPHQACAKLWIEHILSDEGALGYLEGGAMPARFAALEASGKITEDMKSNLPPADLLAQVQFLSQEQIDAANQAIQDNWGPMVADA
jgi:putative spermidine/putrescine transport system substrate-binding protein